MTPKTFLCGKILFSLNWFGIDNDVRTTWHDCGNRIVNRHLPNVARGRAARAPSRHVTPCAACRSVFNPLIILIEMSISFYFQFLRTDTTVCTKRIIGFLKLQNHTSRILLVFFFLTRANTHTSMAEWTRLLLEGLILICSTRTAVEVSATVGQTRLAINNCISHITYLLTEK